MKPKAPDFFLGKTIAFDFIGQQELDKKRGSRTGKFLIIPPALPYYVLTHSSPLCRLRFSDRPQTLLNQKAIPHRLHIKSHLFIVS